MIPTETPEAPPQVVLDTNAVLDWLVFRDVGMSPLAAAIEAGRLRWITTPRMREELLRTLSYSGLAKWTPNSQLTLTLFDRLSKQHLEPPPSRSGPLICTDPDDQVFIDLAITQEARWLVSHDRALHKLARAAAKAGVKIVRPRDWHEGVAG
ncbi:MAG: putative toxin-antitoxin system toxin component, PIN family [Rubrivivax sp.]|nr:putative toxin-antitoxin system toxin component, PIN family [Rubrivivax sp.]